MGIGADWFILLSVFYSVCRFPNILTFAFGIIVVGVIQHALFVYSHDGVHFLVSRNRFLNDWLTRLLATGPIFFSLYSWRAVHFAHHKAPLTTEDPDISLTGGYPVGRFVLVRRLLRDFTGRTYYKFFKTFNLMPQNNILSLSLIHISEPTRPY